MKQNKDELTRFPNGDYLKKVFPMVYFHYSNSRNDLTILYNDNKIIKNKKDIETFLYKRDLQAAWIDFQKEVNEDKFYNDSIGFKVL